MSGHNKWSKIKHKKATTDAQKSKIFGKMTKLLVTESKRCDGNQDDSGLRSAIEQAKAVNMPLQNIERAIERGMGAGALSLESVTYESYGPGGCGILIETLTDSRNRTAAEIRHILSTHGATISAPGSAAWMFTKENNTIIPTTTTDISKQDAEKLQNLVSALLDQDDVQEVHTNNA